jgi:hypothetical protein
VFAAEATLRHWGDEERPSGADVTGGARLVSATVTV